MLVLDGREGRPDNAPKLTPEYLAKWEVIRKSRMAGSAEYDPNVRCVSGGMPNMMSMTYGMEIQQTKDRITIYGELNDVYRRIYLDGRKPSAKVLDDPTFAGYSTGHWEGDTLVVDTVAIREDALFDTFSPHSDQFTVRERIRFASPGVLEDQFTDMDPKALVEPFHSVRYVSEGGAAERRTARVLVCGGIGVHEVRPNNPIILRTTGSSAPAAAAQGIRGGTVARSNEPTGLPGSLARCQSRSRYSRTSADRAWTSGRTPGARGR